MSDLVPAGGVVVDAELVDALIEEWIGAKAKESRHTEKAYRRDAQMWRDWCSGHGVDPLRAHLRDGDRWIAELATRPSRRTGRPLAKASRARAVAAVSSLYAFLVDREYLQASPLRTDGRPKPSKTSTTVGLSAEETVLLRQAARESSHRDHAVIEVLLLAGLRVSELADLNVRSYSWNRGRRTLIVIGKGEKRREVRADDFRKTLDAHLQATAQKLGLPDAGALDPDSPMFPTVSGGRLAQQSVMATVQRLAKAAGIPAWSKISPHSLRHTCATGMLDAGVPINEVKEQLGHEDINTTLRYDRARGSLDRSGTGTYATYLAKIEQDMGAGS